MRFFYGLYVKDERLAAALDLIRFLAEPNFFRRAHITVRGPYSERVPDEIKEISKGKTYRINFGGIGKFFEGTQNTIFLKCEIPGIEDVWNKPDFGDRITPHLTFYDGPQRSFAFGISNALEKFDWSFEAELTPLTEIETKSDPRVYLDEFKLHQRLHEEILGHRLDYKGLPMLPWRQRVVYVSWVADFVMKNY